MWTESQAPGESGELEKLSHRPSLGVLGADHSLSQPWGSGWRRSHPACPVSPGRLETHSPWVCTQEVKAQPHLGTVRRHLSETSMLEVAEGWGFSSKTLQLLSGFLLSLLGHWDGWYGSSPFCHNCLLLLGENLSQ